MEIVTSWMIDGERKMLLLRLRKRFGEVDPAVTEQIQTLPVGLVEELARLMLDFAGPNDLDAWLQGHPVVACARSVRIAG